MPIERRVAGVGDAHHRDREGRFCCRDGEDVKQHNFAISTSMANVSE